MTKEILRLAEQLYINKVQPGDPAGYLKTRAQESIKADEVFYQVKGEIETGVGK